ncbi:hypothetical protein C3E98_019165 [Pseudomonas sp. MWU13-2625]|nr:hypothetical protein C3E98_019165 [Pseudomonas sp. MWU13-2625]
MLVKLSHGQWLTRQCRDVALMTDQHAELNDQIFHWQRLQRLCVYQSRCMAADAIELMKNAFDQPFPSTGWAVGERDLAAHKGGAVCSFIHF